MKWPAMGKGGGGVRKGERGGGRSSYWEMPFETAGQSGQETLDAGRGGPGHDGRRGKGVKGFQ